VQESANPHASRNGVIEHGRTDYRRLGYGRLLVAAARTLGTGYRWTTNFPLSMSVLIDSGPLGRL
jgi:hypothetical protein